jgi:transcriptional regulator with XRE-family HTH domain
VAGEDVDLAYGKRRRLANELRALRELSGLTGRELARRIGISQSKVSRIEAATVQPSIVETTAWARATGAPDEAERLLAALADAAHTEIDTWQAALEGRPQLQDEMREREAAATLTRTFQPAIVPGLLQTPAYAQRVFTMFKSSVPQTSVAAAVAARMDRQLALHEEGKKFDYLITEAALRWRPGPRRLLIAQLDRIAMVSTLDNVSIGVIPFAVEAETVYGHGFTLLEEDDDDSSPFVLVEVDHAWLTVTAGRSVALYQDRWAALRKAAVFGDEARTFLDGLSAELRATGD